MAASTSRDVPVPSILIRPDVIQQNTAAITDRFDGRLVGVTKAVTGDPVIAKAMLEGGAHGLADSRTENLAHLSESHEAHLTKLVGPMLSDLDRIVRVADRTLQSEPRVIEALAQVARDCEEPHEVVIMVDIGDRREGVLPDDLVSILDRIVDIRGVEIVGFGTVVGCFAGVVPTRGQLEEFVSLVEETEAAIGREFPVVSGGSSVTLPLLEGEGLPVRVNELRVGEAILLGTNITLGRSISYLRNDAFEIHAEVVECKHKPSTPEGRRGFNVDGERPDFTDRGIRKRAIVALGKQDAAWRELKPLTDGIEVLGASSDHTVLDVTDADHPLAVGDTIRFRPGYHALVQAFTSPYVYPSYVSDKSDLVPSRS